MVFLSLITCWFGELAAVHRKYHTYLTLLPSVLVTPPLQGHRKLCAEKKVEKSPLFLVLFFLDGSTQTAD